MVIPSKTFSKQPQCPSSSVLVPSLGCSLLVCAVFRSGHASSFHATSFDSRILRKSDDANRFLCLHGDARNPQVVQGRNKQMRLRIRHKCLVLAWPKNPRILCRAFLRSKIQSSCFNLPASMTPLPSKLPSADIGSVGWKYRRIP